MQSFRTLGQPLLGEMYVAQKERKMIPKIVDTSFRCNAQGQRTNFEKKVRLGQQGSPSCSLNKCLLERCSIKLSLKGCSIYFC